MFTYRIFLALNIKINFVYIAMHFIYQGYFIFVFKKYFYNLGILTNLRHYTFLQLQINLNNGKDGEFTLIVLCSDKES